VFDPYEGPKKPRKAKQMPDKLQFVPKKDDSLKLKSQNSDDIDRRVFTAPAHQMDPKKRIMAINLIKATF